MSVNTDRTDLNKICSLNYIAFDYLPRQARRIYSPSNYHPIHTSVDGLKNLAIGIGCLAYGLISSRNDTNPLNLSVKPSTQTIWIASTVIVESLIGLVLPIIIVVGVLYAMNRGV